MKENNDNYKGITLISLVITIIILLILAAISIAMLTGENGILTQASRAEEETRAGTVEEQRDLWLMEQNIKIQTKDETMQVESIEEIANRLLSEGLLKNETERNQIVSEGKVTIASREITFYLVEEGDTLSVNDYVDYTPASVENSIEWRVFDVTSTELVLIPDDITGSAEIYVYGNEMENGIDESIFQSKIQEKYGNDLIEAKVTQLGIENLLNKLDLELQNGESKELAENDFKNSIYYELLNLNNSTNFVFSDVKVEETNTTSNARSYISYDPYAEDPYIDDPYTEDPYDITTKNVYGYMLKTNSGTLLIESILVYQKNEFLGGEQESQNNPYEGYIMPLVTIGIDKISDKTTEQENVNMGTEENPWSIK